jgi:uncharacterized protein DUF1835
MTKDADFKKQVRARMATTGEAYTTARKQLLRHRGEQDHALEHGSHLLHVTNGDSVGHTLRESRLGGDVVPWQDVLHEGPVPGDASPEELRSVRAGYVASRWNLPYEEVLREFADRDRRLEEARSGAYLLWFEADLHDQLQLIQVFATLHDLNVAPERIGLISIGEYPEIAHFGGLGELTSAQLESLSPQREQLDADVLALASSAWDTFRSTDPGPLADTSRWTSRRLRFLAEAFARLAEEYPWRSDGLSLTQRRILAAIAPEPLGLREIFIRLWRKESRPFLGDWGCFSSIRDLALAPHPLLRYDGRSPDDPPEVGRVALTETGRRVLAGELDHVVLNGPDRWIGGVHLHPGGPNWRYDERLETLTSEGHGEGVTRRASPPGPAGTR